MHEYVQARDDEYKDYIYNVGLALVASQIATNTDNNRHIKVSFSGAATYNSHHHKSV